MKKKTRLLVLYMIGCFLLGGGGSIIWGLKSLPFVIGLVIIANPYMHKEV